MCLFPEYIRKVEISSHCVILPQIIFWNTFFNIHIIYYVRVFLLIENLWNFIQPYEVRLSLYVRFLLSPETSVYTVETITVSTCTRFTLLNEAVLGIQTNSNIAIDIGDWIETRRQGNLSRKFCVHNLILQGILKKLFKSFS